MKKQKYKSQRRKSDPKSVIYEKVENDARWQPEDDLKLRTAIEQVKDMNLVHSAITFSCYFTQSELENRWHNLLFHPTISRTSQREISLLPYDIRYRMIEQSALFSDEENQFLINEVGLRNEINVEFFAELLQRHCTLFHSCRTPQKLLEQWQILFKYNLLKGQQMPHPSMSLHHQDVTLTERLDDLEQVDLESECLSHSNRVQIRRLEREIDHLTAVWDMEFDPDNTDVAEIEGDFTRETIPAGRRETLIGRGAEVDVDLSAECDAMRIHRRHCTIITDANSKDLTFTLKNLGQRPVVVNGKQLLMEDETTLVHNSLIQIQTVTLFFRVLKRIEPTLKALM